MTNHPISKLDYYMSTRSTEEFVSWLHTFLPPLTFQRISSTLLNPNRLTAEELEDQIALLEKDLDQCTTRCTELESRIDSIIAEARLNWE